jgi:hypothetical protein
MPITIVIPAGSAAFNSVTNEIYEAKKDTTIVLEHSLISLQKWEQQWHVPFLVKNPKKTQEQLVDYLKCMTLSKNIEDYMYYLIPAAEMKRVQAYLEDPRTATIIHHTGRPTRTEIKTAEVIYSDMIQLGIPFECRTWHLNSLLMLIQVCAEKQKPEKKMSNSQIFAQNRALNKLRRAALHTKG